MLNQVSTVYLQVIGSGAYGAPRSLYVFTDHRRYLFNCGEGTQRLASEHKIKLSQLEHIFVTHKSWANVGGLPGALLTLQENGVSNITLHGPPGIDSLYQQAKNFMHFNNLRIICRNYLENNGYFSDDALSIHAIPLWSQDADKEHYINGISKNEGESDSYNSENKEEQNAESSCDNLAIAFICEITPKRGALLPQRCKEFGVPSGPLMGELKQGKDVTLPCGKVVKASEVTKAPDSPSAFIVLELPSQLYIPDLLRCSAFNKYQNEKFVPTVLVHFSPLNVVQSSLYQEWIGRFSSQTNHLFFNEESQGSGSESVQRMQYKLNHIYPHSFPILDESKLDPNSYMVVIQTSKSHEVAGVLEKKLRTDSKPKQDLNEIRNDNDLVNSCMKPSNHFQASTCLAYHIRPHMGIDTSKTVYLNPQSYIQECYEVESFEETLKEVSHRVKEVEQLASSQKEAYPNVLFLGTGSCIPNKVRNTSGIVVNVDSNCSMLLDCGEGTFGQLVRYMGETATKEFLRHLCVIYISHLHADHHIGLIKILLERKAAFQHRNENSGIPKILLFAPKGIRYYLSAYDNDFERVVDLFDLVPNTRLMDSGGFASILCQRNEDLATSTIERLQTCYVQHCSNAFGLLITLKGGFRLTYSGDTMPCQALVDLGMDCDVLIHEATMEDDLLEDAELKRHSTVSQALEIGRRMKAGHVILTHFSQRYSKVPLIDHLPPNVIIAFDNMMVRLCDLPVLPLLYPAFLSVFSEDVEELKKKRIKNKAKTRIKE